MPKLALECPRCRLGASACNQWRQPISSCVDVHGSCSGLPSSCLSSCDERSNVHVRDMQRMAHVHGSKLFEASFLVAMFTSRVATAHVLMSSEALASKGSIARGYSRAGMHTYGRAVHEASTREPPRAVELKNRTSIGSNTAGFGSNRHSTGPLSATNITSVIEYRSAPRRTRGIAHLNAHVW